MCFTATLQKGRHNIFYHSHGSKMDQPIDSYQRGLKVPLINTHKPSHLRYLLLIVDPEPHGVCLIIGYIDKYGSQHSPKFNDYPLLNQDTPEQSDSVQIDDIH